MRIPGHTGLERFEYLSPDVRAKLHLLWIDSIEEYLSLLAATEQSLLERALGTGREAIENSRRFGFALVGPPKITSLTQPQAGGALGCLIDPEMLRLFESQGRIGPLRERPPLGFEKALPPDIRLISRLFPVKDQGQRGTCVAFASVALREFLVNASQELSEQFLHWACKELDGMPGPGTYLRTAMAALSEYGVCRAETWPYNTIQDDSNESQGPPPAAAIKEAPQYRMPSARSVEPSLVEQYKQVLAGNAVAAMPVALATLVFASWYMSPETHRTGKITMPLPFEMPISGHAWCVVGYVDDDSVPGGGYFIVRNSWGNSWAADSPEAAGHALMPYAYVAQCALEAFTGPVEMANLPDAKAEDEMKPFIRTLIQAGRDIEGKRLPTGTKVLANPLSPDEFMEDTPSNRQIFLRNDFSWTAGTRTLVWFPQSPNRAPDFQKQIASALTAKQHFLGSVDENLLVAKGTTLPDVNLPLFFHLLPWEPKIRNVSVIADVTPDLLAQLKRTAGASEDLPWPSHMEETLKTINAAKVYCIDGAGVQMHVMAAFVTPLHVQKGTEPRLVAPDAHTVELVLLLHRQWSEKNSPNAQAFTFVTIGSALPWPSDVQALSASGHCVMLSSPAGENLWNVRTPPAFAAPLSVRDFLDRLKPETRQRRISRIKSYVDELLNAGYEGNIRAEKIKEHTGYRRTAIRDALLALQDSGHYRLYRTADGHLAVDRKVNGKRPKITADSFRRGWLSRHLLTWASPATGVGIWFLKDLLLGKPVEWWGFLFLLPLAYVGRLVDRRISKLLEDKE